MQENITVLDIQKYYDNSALRQYRKPAKLSTYKKFYEKTTKLQNSVIKEIQEPVTPETSVNQEVQTQQPVNNVVPFPTKEVSDTNYGGLNPTYTKEVKTVEPQQPVNNIVNFPSKSKEFYQKSSE